VLIHTGVFKVILLLLKENKQHLGQSEELIYTVTGTMCFIMLSAYLFTIPGPAHS